MLCYDVDMDVSHPMQLFTTSVDSAVLEVLARGESQLTGRAVGRMVPGRSYDAVRTSLDRLVEHGIVLRTPAGRAQLHRLNRDHLAARAIIELATLRQQLFARMRVQVASWDVPPVVAAVFGSTARADGTTSSDIDVLVVRPRGIDVDDPIWRSQIDSFEAAVWSMTGNDVRTLELVQSRLGETGTASVLGDIASEGIEISGSLAVVRRALRGVA